MEHSQKNANIGAHHLFLILRDGFHGSRNDLPQKLRDSVDVDISSFDQ